MPVIAPPAIMLAVTMEISAPKSFRNSTLTVPVHGLDPDAPQLFQLLRRQIFPVDELGELYQQRHDVLRGISLPDVLEDDVHFPLYFFLSNIIQDCHHLSN